MRELEENMQVDKDYCMSSYLMYRFIVDRDKCFDEKFDNPYIKRDFDRTLISDSYELEENLRNTVKQCCSSKRTALALSGGIDSAILAKFMPEGSAAYTFKCIVPGVDVVDETKTAAIYAKECGLEHRIIEIYWEDFEKYSEPIISYKNQPTHSIEVQIYKAALQAKEDGFDSMIFGETADCVYGGHSNLLSKDWILGEFIDRWSFVKPYHVLRNTQLILEPYMDYVIDGYIDVPRFLTDFEYYASVNFYLNATSMAGIQLVVPYAYTKMKDSLDLERVRRGENKYLIRDIFSRLYPGFEIPPKTPMPRPMNEWLSNWEGPVRPEFWPHCVDHMTGDQKWLVWSLEKFLNMIDGDRK